MSMDDTIAAIREQGGIVYLPHPFDRLHSIPDATTLHRLLAEIDVFEVYNARLLLDAFNDEALRFARKYNLPMGAGSDAHVLQGVGTGLVRMRAFETPEEFLIWLRSAEILRRPKSLALPAGPQVGRAGPRAADEGVGPVGGRRADPEYHSRPVPVLRRRHLRALPEEGHRRDERARPRDRRRPQGPSACPCSAPAIPLAEIMLLKHTPQTAEMHEGVAFFGRAGQAVLKSIQRLRVDPMAIYGTNCVKYDGASEERGARFAGARAARRAAEARRGHGARCARHA